MNDSESLPAQLTRLGLTTYEARAYVALVGRDSFTAAQVARQAELPRQRIYDVLESLVSKGLAVARPGGVIKYAATRPALAIERLLSSRRQELSELEVSAARVESLLAEAYADGQRHTDPLQYIEVLREPGAINVRFDELQAAARREILVFTKPPYAKAPEDNLQGLEVARRVEARSLYEESIFEDPPSVQAVLRFLKAGERARVVQELPLKLVIIDAAIVMFGMRDPVASGSDLTIMVVDHPSLASVLRTAFNAYWESGIDFEVAGGAHGKIPAL
ncbi:MAG TPA: helix-turn-helix domain-containing protein [Candidatus Dormibacteraeota bacterium]|nr:helix-turn-helix domain-containing protein [Candidatus Dormibacteraeota bacterium]